jgi:hypothetical protein
MCTLSPGGVSRTGAVETVATYSKKRTVHFQSGSKLGIPGASIEGFKDVDSDASFSIEIATRAQVHVPDLPSGAQAFWPDEAGHIRTTVPNTSYRCAMSTKSTNVTLDAVGGHGGAEAKLSIQVPLLVPIDYTPGVMERREWSTGSTQRVSAELVDRYPSSDRESPPVWDVAAEVGSDITALCNTHIDATRAETAADAVAKAIEGAWRAMARAYTCRCGVHCMRKRNFEIPGVDSMESNTACTQPWGSDWENYTDYGGFYNEMSANTTEEECQALAVKRDHGNCVQQDACETESAASHDAARGERQRMFLTYDGAGHPLWDLNNDGCSWVDMKTDRVVKSWGASE